MTRWYALREEQWKRIKDLLPGQKGTVGVTAQKIDWYVLREAQTWGNYQHGFSDPL